MKEELIGLARTDPATFVSRMRNKLHSLWLANTYPFAAIGKRVSIDRTCELQRSFAKYVHIGDDVVLRRHVWLFLAEIPSHDEPVIVIENGCIIGSRTIIFAKNRVHIERNTIFGPSVFITDHNHAYEDVMIPIGLQGATKGGTVRIGEGSWLGFGAAIICNEGELAIGRNSVVSTNSVVSRSVHPYSIAVGNPARTVKHYDTSQGKWVLGG